MTTVDNATDTAPTKLLRELAEVCDSPTELADIHYATLDAAAQADYDKHLRIGAARRAMRDRTLSVELDVERDIEAGVSPVVARKKLSDEGFVLPDGTHVHWLTATIEQHELRAAYLRTKANGLIRTAQRHEQAAADIEAAGVTCLAEIVEVAS